VALVAYELRSPRDPRGAVGRQWITDCEQPDGQGLPRAPRMDLRQRALLGCSRHVDSPLGWPRAPGVMGLFPGRPCALRDGGLAAFAAGAQAAWIAIARLSPPAGLGPAQAPAGRVLLTMGERTR